jgi:hypothetical protein
MSWTYADQSRMEYSDWVLNHARNQIIATFHQLRAARHQAHVAYLQTLPCFTLYQRWHGNPPIAPNQLHILNTQIQQANAAYRAGVDEDWRRSCLRYPEVLDYYFSLVEYSFPMENHPMIAEPSFGAPVKDIRRVKARNHSVEAGSGKEHRKKEKRRGRTPPAAPMAHAYR